MQAYATALAAYCSPSLPLGPEDIAAGQHFQAQTQRLGVWVEVAGDNKDVLEISWPHDPGDIRWVVWRNAAGCWLDEFDTQNRHGPLPTMAAALALADEILRTEATSR